MDLNVTLNIKIDENTQNFLCFLKSIAPNLAMEATPVNKEEKTPVHVDLKNINNTTPAIDLETVRTLAASKAREKDGTAKLKALLDTFGVPKLSELPEKSLGDFYAKLKEA